MRTTIKVVTVITLVGFLLTSCSTFGGIYDPKKKDDEFSLKRTIGLVIGVAAAVAAAKMVVEVAATFPTITHGIISPQMLNGFAETKLTASMPKKKNVMGSGKLMQRGPDNSTL